MKKIIITGAVVLGTIAGLTSATLAQDYYGGRFGHTYGYQGYGYDSGPSAPDVDRGGPGPRVGAGTGAGIGAER